MVPAFALGEGAGDARCDKHSDRHGGKQRVPLSRVPPGSGTSSSGLRGRRAEAHARRDR
jgi:hypothetical protein